MEFPPLHDQSFGGAVGEESWEGKFLFLPGSAKWSFTILDKYDRLVPDLSGVGDTPKEAFEKLVERWFFLELGGSEMLSQILPKLRQFFNEDGGVKLEHFLV